MDNGLVLLLEYGKDGDEEVLILIVVDNGLVLYLNTQNSLVDILVLILIVVDNGLVHLFVGCVMTLDREVLILIVVDNGLVLTLMVLSTSNCRLS